MFKKWFQRSRNIILLVMLMICLLMIVACIALIAEYSQIVEEEARVIGQQNSTKVADRFDDAVLFYEMKAQAIGDALVSEPIANNAEFTARLVRSLTEEQSADVMFLRYFKDGSEYSSDGQPYDSAIESEAVVTLSALHKLSCAGVVRDRQFSIAAAAFCVPLDNCAYADTLVVFYPVSSVVEYAESLDTGDLSNSVMTAICSDEGEIISLAYSDGSFDVTQHNNIYEVLEKQAVSADIIDSLRRLAATGSNDSYTEKISGENHVIALSSIKDNGVTSFWVTGVYRSSVLSAYGAGTINTVLGLLVVFFALIIAVVIYLLVWYRQSKLRMVEVSETNADLSCPARPKFERAAADIMLRHKATSFAVIALDINHYEYVAEHIGQEQMIKILLQIKNICSGMLELDETYGYDENGRFLLLLHYRDLDMLATRLKSATALASSHGARYASKYAIVLYGGIYLTERSLTSVVGKMIDLAVDAEKANKFQYDFGSFRLYNEMLHSSNVQNEYIETHMESALEHHDFKVFYQAKYNINEKRPDGCEALVRWYNPEQNDYMQPDVFLPLFEANRFIIKLDKFVYEQVCSYIEDSISHGVVVYPVSVNVSRITASESDFTSYYISVKQKHNIPDGYLTIEFTESFAYEDYEMLRQIVQTLHKNGFKCSIDDFGSGFSSYNILKELMMDEIKLDRFFIRNGYSRERDLKILSSVIALGRDLNMKVTQEGVETGDQLALLTSLGCHVIQGYLYSKPLTLTNYIDFLHSDKRF